MIATIVNRIRKKPSSMTVAERIALMILRNISRGGGSC